MHFDPKCLHNRHRCSEICVSMMCKVSNPFVCASCENHHKAETCQIIPYKKVVKEFHKIQGLYTNEMLKYEERVENTFSDLMNRLKAHFLKFREQFEFLNINEKIKDVYDKISKNKESELTGEKIHRALNSKCAIGKSYRIKDELRMRMLKQDIFETFMEVIDKLPSYYSLRNVEQVFDNSNLSVNDIKNIEDKYVVPRKLTSGIMGEHFKYVQEMMGREIYNVHFLYRATENNFEAEAFHKKCDGICNTVTIAKTEYNNVVIGFCPFPWVSPNNWAYQEDLKQECFLISTSKELRGKKFTPVKTKFAIGMHKDYGPCFGEDFVIYNKAHHSKNCWSNFPDVYNSKEGRVQHSERTINSFVGVKDHFEKFNLKEWEVYKLSFGKEDELENSYIKVYKTIPQSN